MRTLWGMVVKQFLLVLLVTWVSCIVIFELVDFFTNLPTLLQYSDNIQMIFKNLYLNLPRSMVVSITPAVLFAITFVLGNLFMRNELIIILGGGISLFKLVTPLLFLSLVLGAAGAVFNDAVAIEFTREKTQFLKEFSYGSNQGVDVLYANRGQSVIYAVEFLVEDEMYNPSVFVRSKSGKLIMRIDAEHGYFDTLENSWVLENAQVFRIDPLTSETTVDVVDTYTSASLSDHPDLFFNNYNGLNDMTLIQATEYIEELKASESSFLSQAMTDYYSRFATALATFVVALFSCGVGSKLKRNILLMSLLLSITSTILFYVTHELMVLFAKDGLIPPFFGAFGATIIGTILGIILFRRART